MAAVPLLILAGLLAGMVPGVTHSGTLPARAHSACPSSPGLKPLIRGLVDRKALVPAAGLQALAVEADWNRLEPNGPGLSPHNQIDEALAANGCTPLRIRVFAGIRTPLWVQDESGGRISVVNAFDTSERGTVGLFWTDSFKQNYDNLQRELAAVYDGIPNIAEIVVSRCTLFYPEPFIRDVSNATDVANLHQAGYTPALDKTCQADEIDSGLLWTQTRVGVAFNPYQVINADGSVPLSDEPFTEQMMGYCRLKLGQRCVLENDSVRDNVSMPLGPDYAPMYAAMTGAAGPVRVTVNGLDASATLGAPLSFQTAVKANLGDFWGTAVWARQRHAASLELPADTTYDYTVGSSAPPWQTLAEVALWFQGDPLLSPDSATAVEGVSTARLGVAQATVDELAAVDTVAGYGDVGAVPFDVGSAEITWPDGVPQAALLTAGTAIPRTTAACGPVQWCRLAISGGDHVLLEEAPAAPAAVVLHLAAGPYAYLPAAGAEPAATAPVAVADAPLAFFLMNVVPPRRASPARLSAAFGDGDRNGRPGDYTAVIDWGDGVVESASVTGWPQFKVDAAHTYGSPGTKLVSLLVADAGGSSVSASKAVVIPGP